jgi:hypothetical protein
VASNRFLDQTLAVHVECYAGYRGEETPVRFRLGDRLVEVSEVIDRWLALDHRYFTVRAAGAAFGDVIRDAQGLFDRSDGRSSERADRRFSEVGCDRPARFSA